jgi:uncharacterized membrane protein YeaQ/YmgE (transglycosylase-associated protein family)
MGHILRLIVVGLIVGVLARFFYPGPVHMGWIGSIVLGVAGSFAAGYLGKAIHPASGEPMHPAGLVFSIIGAMVLIFVGRLLHLV